MRRVIKVYRNRRYQWLDGSPVPSGTLDMLEIGRHNAGLVSAIRNESLAEVFRRFLDEDRHGVFAMIDGVPAGHAWITAPVAYSRVVNSYARLATRECLIHYCFVDPSHRGKGVYAAMLHELTSWALRSRASRVLVDTDVQNTASQRGILRAGFAKDQETLDIVIARRLLWSRHWPTTDD